MKRSLLSLISASVVITVAGQLPSNNSVPRAEFISYDIREQAEKLDLDKNPFLVTLHFREDAGRGMLVSYAEVPYMWLDRDLFMTVTGVPDYEIYVNGVLAGRGSGSHTPVQFDISAFVSDGMNEFSVKPVEGNGTVLEGGTASASGPVARLHSQPKIRVEDFTVSSVPDSTGNHGILELKVCLSNSYNTPETITLGYDIYDPEGKLQYYDMAQVTVAANGRDTVDFKELIYGTGKREWSASKPDLYRGLITIRRDGRMTEYVPYTAGFGTTTLHDATIYRNGQQVVLSAVRYDFRDNGQNTREDIRKIKAAGYELIIVDYPQPEEFYDICDRLGMYVVDQPDINPLNETYDRSLGGAVANQPEFSDDFIDRTLRAYKHMRHHVCIVGWSLGGDSGNGYNLYKTYRLLKSLEPEKAVIYLYADGEWNTDLGAITVTDASEVLK